MLKAPGISHLVSANKSPMTNLGIVDLHVYIHGQYSVPILRFNTRSTAGVILTPFTFRRVVSNACGRDKVLKFHDILDQCILHKIPKVEK